MKEQIVEKKINRNWISVIVFIIFFIALMQIVNIVIINNIVDSKVIINGIFSLTYYENTGGAFGVGQGDTIGFTIISIIVIAIIIRFIVLQRDRINNKTMVALELIIAGGISNLIDRLFRGFVVDYIDINQLIKFPIFNLADICISIGWIILVVSIIIFWFKEVRTLDRNKKNEA